MNNFEEALTPTPLLKREGLLDSLLENYQQQTFQWGQYDCYTLAFDVINTLFPNTQLPNIKNKYYTQEQALEYQKQYSWTQELIKHFEITSVPLTSLKYQRQSPPLSSGEGLGVRLFITQENNFECVHIILGNYLYSMSEKYNLLKIPLNILKLTKPQGQIIKIIKPKALNYRKTPPSG